LEKDRMIVRENVDGKTTRLSVCNYDSYQTQSQALSNHLAGSQQPLSRHLATDKKVKKVNKEKNNSPAHGDAIADEVDKLLFGTKKRGYRKLTGKRLEAFLQFWEAWNSTTDWKKGKADAIDAWLDVPTLTESLLSEILAAAKIESANRIGKFEKNATPIYPQGWINQRRWEDGK
jgi:hypothetical protein